MDPVGIWRRGPGELSGRPGPGRIFSVTEKADGTFLALIDSGGSRVFGRVVSPGSAPPEIGDSVSPVLRIKSRGPPIEYGFVWVLGETGPGGRKQ